MQAFKAAVAQVGGAETDDALAYNVEGSAGQEHVILNSNFTLLDFIILYTTIKLLVLCGKVRFSKIRLVVCEL